MSPDVERAMLDHLARIIDALEENNRLHAERNRTLERLEDRAEEHHPLSMAVTQAQIDMFAVAAEGKG